MTGVSGVVVQEPDGRGSGPICWSLLNWSLGTWTGLVLAAALAAYGLSLGNGFVAADLHLIDPMADGYAPPTVSWLTGQLIGAQVGLFGRQPALMHLVSLLLHGGASLLLLLAARRWAGPATAGMAAVLFAVWSSGSQAIFSVASQGEALAAVLVLLALWLASASTQRPVVQTMSVAVAGMLALMASTQAVALPLLLFLVHHRLRHRQQPLPSMTTHLTAYGLVLAMLLWRLPTWSASIALLDPLTNPLVLQPTLARIILALDGGWSYARLCLLPVRLSADYGVGVIETIPSLITGLRAGALLGLLGVAAWRYHRRADLLSLGLLWWAASLLPVSNVLAPVSSAMSETYLYLPMAGFCLSLAAALMGLRSAASGWQSPALWAGTILVLIMVFRTASRGADWATDERVWMATVAAQPSSARAHEALATALQARGNPVAAEQHYLRAIAIYPRFTTAHYNLGLALYDQQRWQEALSRFDQVCQLQPQHASGHLNRGAALYRLGRWMPAADAYRQAAELRPVWPVPWLNLADALRAAGDTQAAAAAMAQARDLGAVTPLD